MRRNITRVHQGETQTRVVAKMEGNICDRESPQSFAELIQMLRTLCDTPDLLRTETNCPESITIRHNGQNWVVESATTVVRPLDEGR